MNPYDLTDEELLIRQTAREFAEKEVRPLAAEIDRTHTFPLPLLKKLAEPGFTGALAPEEYGGSGLGTLGLALITEELNRVCASTGVTFSVHASLATTPILRFGTEAQKKKYLPQIARVDRIGAYCLSEPSCGSDAAALVTSAKKDGDAYVLDGAKNFITNGGFATLLIVFARTNPDLTLRHKGISAFIVERETPGIDVGAPEKKMGIRGSSTTQVFFSGCRVPAENRLGAEGEGFKVALGTLDGGRIGIAAQALGIAQACLEASTAYAKQRKQFDRPIADFQAVQWKIARMATDLDAARLLVYRAARLRDAGAPHTKESAMAKLFASGVAVDASREAVQIHGGAGYTREHPVERYFRDAKITEIYEGTSEIQKMVVAREVLHQKESV